MQACGPLRSRVHPKIDPREMERVQKRAKARAGKGKRMKAAARRAYLSIGNFCLCCTPWELTPTRSAL